MCIHFFGTSYIYIYIYIHLAIWTLGGAYHNFDIFTFEEFSYREKATSSCRRIDPKTKDAFREGSTCCSMIFFYGVALTFTMEPTVWTNTSSSRKHPSYQYSYHHFIHFGKSSPTFVPSDILLAIRVNQIKLIHCIWFSLFGYNSQLK